MPFGRPWPMSGCRAASATACRSDFERPRSTPIDPGPEARRPPGPDRPPARGALPLDRAGSADREGGRVQTHDTERTAVRAGQGDPPGPTARERGGDRPAALEEEGPRDLQLGRDQLVGLRDGGDPAGFD